MPARRRKNSPKWSKWGFNHQKQADSGGDLFDGDMLGMECGYELDIQTWSIPYPNYHFTRENGG